MPDEEVHAFANALERGIGTHLFGRRMYDTMAIWQTYGDDPEATPVEADYATLWQGLHTVVDSTPSTTSGRPAPPSTARSTVGRGAPEGRHRPRPQRQRPRPRAGRPARLCEWRRAPPRPAPLTGDRLRSRPLEPATVRNSAPAVRSAVPWSDLARRCDPRMAGESGGDDG